MNFFSNNLNLTFLVSVPFLLAVIFIRILIFIEKKKTTTENNFDESKIEKLKLNADFAADSLLYSLCITYVPFLEYFILFTETGQKNHVESWIFIVTYLLLLVIILIDFYRHPSNFTTFWFSFRVSLVTLNHFYF